MSKQVIAMPSSKCDSALNVRPFPMAARVRFLTQTHQDVVKPDGTWPSIHYKAKRFAVNGLKEKYPGNPDPEEIWKNGKPMKAILDCVTRIFRKYFTDDCVDTFFVAHNVACERKYIGQAYELHGTISKNLTRILRHAGNGIDMDAEKWADVEQVWNGFRRPRKKKGKQSLMFEVSRAERIALASLRLYSSERSDVRSHLSPTQPLCRL